MVYSRGCVHNPGFSSIGYVIRYHVYRRPNNGEGRLAFYQVGLVPLYDDVHAEIRPGNWTP